MSPLTLVVTAVGCPGGPSILKSLRRAAAAAGRSLRLVGTDCRPAAAGRHLCDDFHVVPAGVDPEYLPVLADLCRRVGAAVVLPLASPELQPLAWERENWPCRVAVSPVSALAAVEDKAWLYGLTVRCGRPDLVPRHVLARTWPELAAAVQTMGYPARPVAVKPPLAHGSRGFRILREDRGGLAGLLEEKPDGTVTTLAEMERVLAQADPFPSYLAMEYLPGEEWSVDVLAAPGGRSLAAVPRRRVETRGGICTVSEVAANPELAAAAAGLVAAAGLEYAVNLQFRQADDGRPRLLEVNPRLAGTVAATVGAGLNLPWLTVRLSLGEDVGDLPEPVWGTRVERHWEEVYYAPAADRGGGL